MTFSSIPERDAIIVGGGLAGVHLALAMDRIGLFPLVIDQPDPHSSSRIAAGIINPITGRRFAMTWLYDKLEPVFTEAYRYWENAWNVQFFQSRKIYRSVPGNKLVNDLDAKLSDPAYKQFCRKMHNEEIENINRVIKFKPPGYVMTGYQLDTQIFLNAAIDYLTGKGMYLEGRYDESMNQSGRSVFTFQQYQSKRLIWATGASIVRHPLFSAVKMNPNKGEVLHVETKGENINDIIKQSVFLVPESPNETRRKLHKLWIGSFNSWDFQDTQPTTDGLKYLKSRASILRSPYNITDHLAAIRPAVEDRRPVIGAHPKHPNILLFNGFGSKGTSLIPYFAKNLVYHLTKGSEIHPEARISRYV